MWRKHLRPVTIRSTHSAMVYCDPDRFVGQVGAVQTRDGEVLVVYNEARGRAHLDFDSLALIRSRDGGRSWDAESRTVIWPCTEHFGSDTPSIAELSDGALLSVFHEWTQEEPYVQHVVSVRFELA